MQINERLGRAPNDLELAMFSVMWSEHCSYKSSKSLLRTLPTAGSDVLAGPGENAGVVSIGDGLAVAFKIESHNHPSAVEPYQGAATGVGGILRDIVAMGARPVALLDALKFGWPDDHRTRRLVDGVVRGVGGYGNCVGVPTVGGELTFDPTYTGNPLVNVMCVGVLREDGIARAIAPTPGSLAVLFGSATGRDGIGGASVLASANFDEGSAAMRPSVQIGDPFAGKLLIEATLELVEGGLVEGMQDLGAAGLTCATSEVAARGGTGIRVDLAAVPLRETGHGAVRGDDQRVAGAHARHRPRRSGSTTCCASSDAGACAVRSSARSRRMATWSSSMAAPRSRGCRRGRWHRTLRSRATRLRRQLERRLAPAPGETPLAHDGLPERGMDPGAVLEALLGHPNLGSRAWVTTQYDQTVGTDTIEGCEHAAAVLRVKGTKRALVDRDRLASRRSRHYDPALAASAGAWPSARATSRSPAPGRWD